MARALIVRLRDAFRDVHIDTEEHVHIQAGPAIGHGFELDEITLAQVRRQINSHPKGVKSRLTHPGLTDCGGHDGIEVLLGRVTRAHLDGEKLRGDLRIGAYAAKGPHGDLRDYVETLVAEDPEVAGLSIVFEPDRFDTEIVEEPRPEAQETEDGRYLVAYARSKATHAADIVGDPAANRDGFLSTLPKRLRDTIGAERLEKWAAELANTEHQT